MIQPATEWFRTDRHVRIETLLKLLEKQFVVERSAGTCETHIYYDTFDWRLYRRKQLFYRCGNRLELIRFSGRPVAEATAKNRSKIFWWDIEASTLRDELRGSLEMRALCPIVSIESTSTEFRIMNSDRKTVARISLRSDVVDGQEKPLPETVVVEEIRGYDGPYGRIVQNCVELGLKKIGRDGDGTRILELSGRTPGGYGDKFGVSLDNTVTVGDAVSKICLRLVEDMEANVNGIVADIDSEFLHDFRIAVRRTRSLISLLKKMLPEEMSGYFAGEFKWLGSVTGPVRDIDVYLLEKDDYVGLLTESLRPGMELFFDDLKERRVGELKLLQAALRSPRYEALVKDWRHYLTNRKGPLFAGDMDGNCRACADAMIRARFKRFLRDGCAITDASADEDLHRLRIKGKKFRYLLEFFKSFYDDRQMAVFLKQMKTLQNNLGDFNDLSVQQGLLTDRLDSLRGRNRQTIRLAAALGGLISVLSVKHAQVRRQFGSTWDAFSTDGIRTLLNDMVSANAPGRRKRGGKR